MPKQQPPSKLRVGIFFIIALIVFIVFVSLVGPVHIAETIIALILGVVVAELLTKTIRTALKYIFS